MPVVSGCNVCTRVILHKSWLALLTCILERWGKMCNNFWRRPWQALPNFRVLNFCSVSSIDFLESRPDSHAAASAQAAAAKQANYSGSNIFGQGEPVPVRTPTRRPAPTKRDVNTPISRPQTSKSGRCSPSQSPTPASCSLHASLSPSLSLPRPTSGLLSGSGSCIVSIPNLWHFMPLPGRV